MKINEKLKRASLEAEITEYKKIPDDSEIDWEPSKEFNEKSEVLLQSVQAPKRRFLTPARVAVCASIAVAAAILAVGHIASPNGLFGESVYYSENVTSEISPALEEVYPKYIPDGYVLSDKEFSVNGSTRLEYTNGNSKIVFYSYPAKKIDYSQFDDVIGVFETSENIFMNATNFAPVETPEFLANNSIAWNNGSETFVVLNNADVSVDELLKIAQSVEENETD
ncbi:MAG: DUF4367 domain-containing protein [Clostridia bacterium]|nr:DUF4367 domain-containing protein [Clostridia bacterium]